MKIVLFVSWNLEKVGDDYYIANMHYSYLQYITCVYEFVYLITPVRCLSCSRFANTLCEFTNISVVELPYTGNYLHTIRFCRKYWMVVKQISESVDLFYCRCPDPFSWMPALITNKKTIMHFVGDAIDATKHNEDWPMVKKIIMILGYLPDYLLTIIAARHSMVYTNGYHLSKRLSKFGIHATPVVSSTIRKSTLVNPTPLPSVPPVRLIYVGYIRYAKGMNCLLCVCKLLKKRGVPFRFDVVGRGEMFDEVKTCIEKENLSSNVTLHGHVDNRDKMNELLRQSNLFFFPSLSEGSPRVVVEAMSQGVPVLSTPVGSLPYSFKEGETIRFFDFDDANKACDIIMEYIENPRSFVQMRDNAYLLVKENYTIEKFLSTVFSYEA